MVEPDAVEILPQLVRHYGEPFADSSAIPSFYSRELTRRARDRRAQRRRRRRELRRLHALRREPRGRRSTRSRCGCAGSARAARRSASRQRRRAQHRSTARAASLSALPLDAAGRYGALHELLRRGRARQRLYTRRVPRAASATAPSPSASSATPGRRERRGRCSTACSRSTSETYLPDDLLVKMDIATMAHSLEARSPFLDHELMEFAAALPAELKLRGTRKKGLLRDALRPWLPAEILDRPKQGFCVPLARLVPGRAARAGRGRAARPGDARPRLLPRGRRARAARRATRAARGQLEPDLVAPRARALAPRVRRRRREQSRPAGLVAA